MQEVVSATLLEKVQTSIERNKSLQMLFIRSSHDVLYAVLKGAFRNTSLKDLIMYSDPVGYKAAAAKLQQVRPQLKFVIH